MDRIYKYIDNHTDRMLNELFTLLKQPSVSSQGLGINTCAKLLSEMMNKVGIQTRILTMGGPNNPPLVFGELLSPGAHKTMLIYGHFDVQPTDPLSEWDSPPFEPAVRDERIYARGASDNKGQLFAHIKAVEAILNTQKHFPVNLKFLCDPEEEIGSPSLEGYVKAHTDLFKADVIYNSDASLDASGRPLLCFGSRGNCHVEINHREANRDLHSGQYGGAVTNPNWRVIRFLDTLMDKDGRVAIDGFYDEIVPPTPAERNAISNIPFNAEKMLKDLGIGKFAGPDEMSFWEKIMFQPTLEICGYTSGYGGTGSKTVLPSKTNVKISMRLVKNQTPQDIFRKFKAHALKYEFNDLDIQMKSFYLPARTPIDHPAGKAIIAAVKRAFGADPVIYPSIGGSNPSSIFTEYLKLPFIKVPYGNHDDNAHSPNENLRVELFVKGIKTSATVFYELGKQID